MSFLEQLSIYLRNCHFCCDCVGFVPCAFVSCVYDHHGVFLRPVAYRPHHGDDDDTCDVSVDLGRRHDVSCDYHCLPLDYFYDLRRCYRVALNCVHRHHDVSYVWPHPHETSHGGVVSWNAFPASGRDCDNQVRYSGNEFAFADHSHQVRCEVKNHPGDDVFHRGLLRKIVTSSDDDGHLLEGGVVQISLCSRDCAHHRFLVDRIDPDPPFAVHRDDRDVVVPIHHAVVF